MVLAQCIVNDTGVLEGLDLNFDGNGEVNVADVMTLAQMVVNGK